MRRQLPGEPLRQGPGGAAGGAHDRQRGRVHRLARGHRRQDAGDRRVGVALGREVGRRFRLARAVHHAAQGVVAQVRHAARGQAPLGQVGGLLDAVERLPGVQAQVASGHRGGVRNTGHRVRLGGVAQHLDQGAARRRRVHQQAARRRQRAGRGHRAVQAQHHMLGLDVAERKRQQAVHAVRDIGVVGEGHGVLPKGKGAPCGTPSLVKRVAPCGAGLLETGAPLAHRRVLDSRPNGRPLRAKGRAAGLDGARQLLPAVELPVCGWRRGDGGPAPIRSDRGRVPLAAQTAVRCLIPFRQRPVKARS